MVRIVKKEVIDIADKVDIIKEDIKLLTETLTI